MYNFIPTWKLKSQASANGKLKYMLLDSNICKAFRNPEYTDSLCFLCTSIKVEMRVVESFEALGIIWCRRSWVQIAILPARKGKISLLTQRKYMPFSNSGGLL